MSSHRSLGEITWVGWDVTFWVVGRDICWCCAVPVHCISEVHRYTHSVEVLYTAIVGICQRKSAYLWMYTTFEFFFIYLCM